MALYENPILYGLLESLVPNAMRGYRDTQFRNLIGEAPEQEQNAPGVTSYGLLDQPGGQSGAGVNTTGIGGSGLLGGNLGQQEFMQRMGQIGGRYADAFVNHTSNSILNQEARQWEAENMTAYQNAYLQETISKNAADIRMDELELLETHANNAARLAMDRAHKVAGIANDRTGDYLRYTAPQFGFLSRVDVLAQNLDAVENMTIDEGGPEKPGDWSTHTSNALDTQMMSALAAINDPVGAITDDAINQALRGLGWTEQWLQKAKNVADGKGVLSPRQRKDIMRAIQAAEGAKKNEIQQIEDAFGFGLNEFGIPGSAVFPKVSGYRTLQGYQWGEDMTQQPAPEGYEVVNPGMWDTFINNLTGQGNL